MFEGETIEITHKSGDIETLADVLVEPQEQVDIPASTGAEERTAYILHFPKGYAGDLVGARVVLRGKRFRVLGHPKHYTAENNPLDWNMPVKVARLGYTHTLEIQSANATLSDKGDSVTEWLPFLTTTCRMADVEQTEEQKGGRTLGAKKVQIVCDWANALSGLFNTTARAIVDGETFDITVIKNVNWENDICVILAVHNGE